MNSTDIVLATLGGEDAQQRVCVLLRQAKDGGSRIILAEQSFNARVGWYNQQSVELEPTQWAQLRSVMGAGAVPPAKVSISAADRSETPATLKFPSLSATA